MNYEKLYKEALSRAKDYVEKQNPPVNILYEIFPELAENGDEMIRKRLIDLIYKVYVNTSYITCVEHEEMLAWLEKQGQVKENQILQHEGTHEDVSCKEKGNSLTRESKFKVGDWVVYNYSNTVSPISKIIQMDGGIVELKDTNGSRFQTEIDELNCNYHLWNISDAKDGDVLCAFPYADFPWIGIFHELNNGCTFNSYCYLQAGVNGKFCPPSEINIFNKRNIDGHSSKTVVPATKEQRDTLMKAMTDAGYTFDFEKKELRKISQRMVSGEVKEALYDKPTTWSEEDEEMARKTLVHFVATFDGDCSEKVRLADWLKALKQRLGGK